MNYVYGLSYVYDIYYFPKTSSGCALRLTPPSVAIAQIQSRLFESLSSSLIGFFIH